MAFKREQDVSSELLTHISHMGAAKVTRRRRGDELHHRNTDFKKSGRRKNLTLPDDLGAMGIP